MKNKFVFLIIYILGFVFNIHSQQQFFLGDNVYPCTDWFSLEGVDMQVLNNKPFISFAKNGATGMVIFRVQSSYKIVGTTLLYLDNNTVIKLYDKNVCDCVDDYCTSVYYLTSAEVLMLKSSNISIIRYNVRSPSDQYAVMPSQSYTLENKGYYYMREETPRLDFPLIITDLFKP